MQNGIDTTEISRRDFLKLSGASLAALFALSIPKAVQASSLLDDDSAAKMGRVVANNIAVYDIPDTNGKQIKTYYKDEVLPITQIVVGTGEPTYNKIWYLMNNEGYVHSGNVQPVQIDLNSFSSTISANGQLAEVTVPFTDAIWNPNTRNKVAYRMYYSTTHWVIGTLQDSKGKNWYEILEDFYQFHYFIQAEHLRMITAEEATPLSPDVPSAEKLLKVHLDAQTVVAYEGDQAVQMFRCSSGVKPYDTYMTPTGDFSTDYKRPSRHMINGNKATANTFDLPGVPWVSYFTDQGISFHGTYWHNDFGRPRSHGCINLPSESARWVYRWTIPEVNVTEQKFYKKYGTKVTITTA